MKKMKKWMCFFTILALGMTIAFTGCGQNDSAGDDGEESVTAKCYNGNFKGALEDNGVMAFKGIPYAKAPTGDLRWKAPEAVEKSNEEFDALEFGKSAIQTQWHSEAASYHTVSEDCLTLNVWTKDLKGTDKPVMLYIHGGGYAWGGTADPLYNGKHIVEEHEDMIVVTCNYRLGAMGFVDFSDVPGGEAFPDSGHLGVLDLIQGLKWVKQNIKSFGGDPENITLFGESAGSGLISTLLVVDEAQGLFQKAIAQSGSLNLLSTKEEYDESGQTALLLKRAGAKSMEDLMDIPEDKLIELYREYDKDGNCVGDINNKPLRDGTFIPEDPYKALANGVSKDVKVMIGTNSDEFRYWINEMGDVEMSEMDEAEIQENLKNFEDRFLANKYDAAMTVATKDEKKMLKQFLETVDEDEDIWKRAEMANEMCFRLPSIDTAYNHAKGGGDTYMYYFCKKSDNFDFIGSCHASEVAYVFHNLKETIFSGTVDEGLADKMCGAWTNFARNGDPSLDDAQWTLYGEERDTMVIGDDCSMKMKRDPLKEQRKLLAPFVKYYLK